MKRFSILTTVALLGACVVATANAFAQDGAQADRPKQALTEVPFTEVKLTDDFWAPRIEANRVVSVPHNIKWCETETKRIANFRNAGAKLQGKEHGDFGGIYFDDSDVYKILEGFAYSLSAHPDAELQKKADEWIDAIGSAQEEDGYLMAYFTLMKPNEKWTNLAHMHELYCAGHMAEAAVAYYRATGDDKFLKINRRVLDLICKRYGPNEGQLKNVPGHEEIELALVKMYQLTGDRKYLDQAKFFVDIRGVADGRQIEKNSRNGLFGEYCQDHAPVREQSEIVGHAVRAMYLYCGATDVAGYYRDPELMAAMKRIFNNVTRHKMYITGGIGSSASNEGFEENFKLPNKSAYCETCAAIGMMFWAHRMNLATGEAKYADVMELAMYNGFMSGYGLNGDSYFYVNPLASDGGHHRQPFFGCACCPSNVIRALPSVPGYVYATASSKDDGADDTVVVNMFVEGKATVELADKIVEIAQTTRYPYDGKVFIKTTARMKDENAEKTPFTLKVRVPGWALAEAEADGYRSFARGVDSFDGAVEALVFETPVVRTIANPKVKDDLGRVALKRGPVVYCFEQVDNPGVRVDRIILAKDPQFKIEQRVITGNNANAATKNSAARKVDVILAKDYEGRTLVAIPYCVWDNRAAGKMAVWVRQVGLTDAPAADSELGKEANWIDAEGLPILYKPLDASLLTDEVPQVANSPELTGSFFTDERSLFDGTNAGNPKHSGDQGVPRATWWPRKGSKEWFQIEYPKARKIKSATIYWFDDTKERGGCATPKSWKLTYQTADGADWKEVETTDAYSVERDKEIVVNFAEVEALRVRVEVQLQDGLSGGVLKMEFK